MELPSFQRDPVERRRFLSSLFAFSGAFLLPSPAFTSSGDPWPPDRILEPAALADALKGTSKPTVICVAFPVLYRAKHIPGALFAGPTSKPEGIEALKAAVQTLAKTTEVVLYCGCCPMEHCPNIRPAYNALAQLGYSRVFALDLRTNFRTDWEDKGFPTQPGGVSNSR